MKKFLIFLIFLSVFLLYKVESNSKYSYLIDDYSYNIYSISIDGLNTNNFLDYFNDIAVISIYPFVNPIYLSNIGDVKYTFRSSNINNEVNKFKDSYLKLIKKNSYSDYNYLYMNGVSLSKVDVYISGNQLYYFLINNNAYIV